ncbi:CBS domain, partial [Dillenia turbinata]
CGWGILCVGCFIVSGAQMFYSGGDSARDGGTVLIPTRFVWPYGGANVSIIGSFTGWTDNWQMSPIEGCPTVFQIVCRLPPGYHQYKFIVDGEWRHDDHQPFVSGSDGTVNTIFLARESDHHSSVQSPRPPSGSNMDVDNENFRRVVRVSENPVQEAVPMLSEADFQVSRYRVSEFLSNHTAYELLPDSGKVIALDIDLPVKQAFHILYEQGIPMAPLWDLGRGQFVGVISALDFILILRELGNHGSNLTEEELETHTISAWKEEKLHLSRQMNMAVRPFPAHLIHAGPFDNLKDVALKILQNGVATVPIIHSSLQDGSLPQLLHIASLSGILKCICRYFRHSSTSLPILQLPICAIPLGTWVPQFGKPALQQFAMLRPSDSLNSALKLLLQAQVSSIPIVDDRNSLLDIYSRSDITALAKDRAYTHINLDEMTIHQALQLRQDAYSSFEFSSQRCHMCLRADPLHKVMERLSIPGVRQLVIVEAGSKRVEGIISLSDIFKFLLS